MARLPCSGRVFLLPSFYASRRNGGLPQKLMKMGRETRHVIFLDDQSHPNSQRVKFNRGFVMRCEKDDWEFWQHSLQNVTSFNPIHYGLRKSHQDQVGTECLCLFNGVGSVSSLSTNREPCSSF